MKFCVATAGKGMMTEIRPLFEICYLTFLTIYILYCLFLYVHGIREREYISFGLLASVYLAYFFLNSSFVLHLNLFPHIVPPLIVVLMAIIPATLVYFIACTVQEEIRGRIGWAVYPWLLLALIAPFKSSMSLFGWDCFRLACAALACYALVILWQIAFRAHSEGFYESIQLTMGVGCITVGTGLVAAGQIRGVSIPYYMEDLVFACFSVTMKYGLIKRYARYVSDLQRLSGKILNAHEEERKRLARDIHDGIGQSLLAIKLNLQMMKADRQKAMADGSLTTLIAAVSRTIEELRQITMDLTPTFIQKGCLADILRWYGEKFAEKTQIKVVIDVDDDIEVDVHTKDNLYRIYQEALGNAFKHSGCQCIEVMLKQYKGKITLKICDDGAGLDRKKIMKKDGIGLSTMRDRAELLGGAFSIRAVQGGGTVIHVGVPL